MLKHLSFYLAFIWLAACSTQKISEEEKATARLQTDLARAEADSAWQTMMRSDVLRLENTAYFFTLLKYTDDDTSKIAPLRTVHNGLVTKQFDQYTLREKVDVYDAGETEVLAGLEQIYNGSEGLKKMMNAEQALQAIKAADDSILIYRTLYDQAAIRYNTALSKNKDALKASGVAEAELKPLPLFRINS